MLAAGTAHATTDVGDEDPTHLGGGSPSPGHGTITMHNVGGTTVANAAPTLAAGTAHGDHERAEGAARDSKPYAGPPRGTATPTPAGPPTILRFSTHGLGVIRSPTRTDAQRRTDDELAAAAALLDADAEEAAALADAAAAATAHPPTPPSSPPANSSPGSPSLLSAIEETEAAFAQTTDTIHPASKPSPEAFAPDGTILPTALDILAPPPDSPSRSPSPIAQDPTAQALQAFTNLIAPQLTSIQNTMKADLDAAVERLETNINGVGDRLRTLEDRVDDHNTRLDGATTAATRLHQQLTSTAQTLTEATDTLRDRVKSLENRFPDDRPLHDLLEEAHTRLQNTAEFNRLGEMDDIPATVQGLVPTEVDKALRQPSRALQRALDGSI